MGLSKNPLRILIGAISVVFGLSAILRMFHYEAAYKSYTTGQYLIGYNWVVDNCKKLNITEIDDIDNFEGGCYHFVGHLRIEGNLTMPPLVETTQCPSIIGFQYVSQYGTYLAKQCNFNGQHPECASYNPACQVDPSKGLGYEVRHGWIPNPDSLSEAYHGDFENYEWEVTLQQSDEWKEACVKTRLGILFINHERCSIWGEGGTSICAHDYGFPDTHFMNNTRVIGYIEELMGGPFYEMGGFWQFNDPENLPIYDIGKGPGTTAIHFNALNAIEETMRNLHKEIRTEHRAKYPDGNDLEFMHPLNIAKDTTHDRVGYSNYRDLSIVMKQRYVPYYANIIAETLSGFNKIVIAYNKQKDVSEGRWFTPTSHPYGPIVHVPNPLGDSFYSDPDLEAARLNGTTRSNEMMEFLEEEKTYYPFAFSEEIWNKMRANGGQFTDAEFKALPEYGDPEYFPLVANETRWEGGNNCWHEEGHMYTPRYSKHSRKFSPYCRIEEPTDFPIEFLGLVHKKTNRQTGQPMLVWNGISFSNNTFNGHHDDMSKSEASLLNQLPHDIPRFNEREAALYPDYYTLLWLLDVTIRGLSVYGEAWFYNGLNKSKWGKCTLYAVTWLFPGDTRILEFQEYDETLPLYQDYQARAAFAAKEHQNGWYVMYAMAVIFWVISALIMLWESKAKRSSEES